MVVRILIAQKGGEPAWDQGYFEFKGGGLYGLWLNPSGSQLFKLYYISHLRNAK